MTCCRHAAETHFSARIADRDLARYRKHGPGNTTRALLEAIRATDLRGATLLDVGAGIGVLHHELLDDTISAATHAEVSPAYVAAARIEAERIGHGKLVHYLIGDVAELRDELPEADLVTLDRVICCDPNWQRLLTVTAAKARAFYAISLPHDRWYVRLVMALANFGRRLKRDPFRTFVHPVADIERLLARLGFRQEFVDGTLAWHIALYAREKRL